MSTRLRHSIVRARQQVRPAATWIIGALGLVMLAVGIAAMVDGGTVDAIVGLAMGASLLAEAIERLRRGRLASSPPRRSGWTETLALLFIVAVSFAATRWATGDGWRLAGFVAIGIAGLAVIGFVDWSMRRRRADESSDEP